MRQRDGIRSDGGRPDAPTAGERGWDDSLYEQPRPPGRRSGDHDRLAGAEQRRTGDDGRKARGGARTRRKRPRRRILRWVVLALSLLVLGTAGAGYLYLDHLNDNLDKDALNLGDNKLDKSAPNAAGQRPLNILLLGSDSRNSERNVELGGSHADRGRPPLADVQMLLHLSADRSNMSVVSVPRDTRVTIPKCTDPDDGRVYPETTAKINSSLQHGGPGCTVATWEALTGIPVDHFMMVDFAGVVAMADAVGGVPVCVDANVHDERSGLRLEKGTTVVKGEQALQWLRTRHGFEDGSDIGRAKAQHMYMASMVRQLKAGTKLSDPGKLRQLAEAATEALTVDHGLGSVKKLYDLGNQLKKVPTKRITMTTMPWEYSQGGTYVLPKPGDAEQVFSLIRQDIALDGRDEGKPEKDGADASRDPAAPKADIPVRVLNGTGTAAQAPVNGRAAEVAGVLEQDGFAQAVADATPKSQVDTVIRYAAPDQHGDALAVAESLGLPESRVRHSSAVDGIALVVGADWRSGSAYPASGDGGEETGGNGGNGDTADNKAPESADPLSGNEEKCMHVNPNNVW
ncbi:LCP family protein [Streptomyces sp. JJ36]|uniref:LCP family protein n=1 Tax=Streptomyces sp. JJ36 TaxID=2736645 RepID=UPI001F3B9062|nr:LCP family protein [Streptomyces sp. JJ36]MCF6524019.1 LCP family protein [Streptomyces sp. JJ36]